MIRYECIKLAKNKILLLFSVLLLLGNLLLLLGVERNTYRYEKTEEEQEEYLASYDIFIDEMEQRAAELKQTKAFEDTKSFVYRNLEKTCADFAQLADTEPETGINTGTKALAEYRFGMLFLILFLFLLLYEMFYEERNKGLFLLLKGTKRGHMPLFGAKLVVSALWMAGYIGMQEGSVLIAYGIRYGYGDLGRAVQSISEFRNCPYRITVGTLLILTLLIRLIIAEVLLLVLAMLSVGIRNELLWLCISTAVLAVEFLAEQNIAISSVWNYFHCVNLFFCWDMENTLGTYHNLNIAGYAVGKDAVTVTAAGTVAVIAVVLGTVLFHKLCQIRAESRLEKILFWLRKRMSGFWHISNRNFFEWRKIFFQQKRGSVLTLLLLFVVSETVSGQQEAYYATPGIAAYHGYLKQLSGKVTEESITYVQEQEEYLAGLYEQLAEVAVSTEQSEEKEFLSNTIMAQIEQSEDGVMMISQQLADLEQKDGNLSDKYWVDEESYMDCWEDIKTDILYWAAAAMGITLWISGIYAYDKKKKLINLLNSMKHGGEDMEKSKRKCAWAGAGVIIAMTEIPAIIRYAKIDSFAVCLQKMCDFTRYQINTEMPLGVFLVLVLLIKISMLLLATWCIHNISQKVQDEMLVNVAGICATGVVVIVCLRFHINIAGVLIRMLNGIG